MQRVSGIDDIFQSKLCLRNVVLGAVKLHSYLRVSSVFFCLLVGITYLCLGSLFLILCGTNILKVTNFINNQGYSYLIIKKLVSWPCILTALTTTLQRLNSKTPKSRQDFRPFSPPSSAFSSLLSLV